MLFLKTFCGDNADHLCPCFLVDSSLKTNILIQFNSPAMPPLPLQIKRPLCFTDREGGKFESANRRWIVPLSTHSKEKVKTTVSKQREEHNYSILRQSLLIITPLRYDWIFFLQFSLDKLKSEITNKTSIFVCVHSIATFWENIFFSEKKYSGKFLIKKNCKKYF